MSFLSLIAHNGVTHQKYSSEHKAKPPYPKTKTDRESNIDSQTVVPEGNTTSEKQVVETPENKTENSNTTEIQAIQEESVALIVIVLGRA